jgi:hypothetical protein
MPEMFFRGGLEVVSLGVVVVLMGVSDEYSFNDVVH